MNFHQPSIPTLAQRSSSQHPYEASIASSASSSSSSIFSIDAPSQSSQASCSSRSSATDSISSGWIGDQIDWKAPSLSRYQEITKPVCLPLRTCTAPVAPEQRQHPRRRSISSNVPPALVRQSDRKGQFVDCLVDSATQMVEVVWPLSVPHCPGETKGILPLRTFIQETLRRSRTSFSTLQVALYYLILIKMHVPACDFTMEQQEDAAAFRALQCGRRMFLSALILASKYLQDRNYSARAWSKISGLKVQEINLNEMAFLRAVSWELHIKEETFEKWQDIILQYTPQHATTSPACWADWKALVRRLTPDLEGVNVRSSRGSCRPRKAQTWPLQPPSPVTPTCVTPTCITPTPASVKPLASTSNETTPTPLSAVNLPRYLEPRPDLRPPTPVRLGPLPTPSMTPQSVMSSSAANTPAASVMSATSSRRSSMCAAMQAAQSCFASNMASRWAANCPFTGRIPCLMPSGANAQSLVSMTSSPESMMSDAASTSSRSSRASSISSVSSSCTGLPTGVKLARAATLRCARSVPLRKELGLITEPEIVDPDGDAEDGISIEPMMSSPDFQGLNISEVVVQVQQTPEPRSASSDLMKDESPASPRLALTRETSATSTCSASSTGSRKRGRSSGGSTFDSSLQQYVRDILIPGSGARANQQVGGSRVRDDTNVAARAAMLMSNNDKIKFAWQHQQRQQQQRRCDDGRRKRLCKEEAAAERQRRWELMDVDLDEDVDSVVEVDVSEIEPVTAGPGLAPMRFAGPGMWAGVL